MTTDDVIRRARLMLEQARDHDGIEWEPSDGAVAVGARHLTEHAEHELQAVQDKTEAMVERAKLYERHAHRECEELTALAGGLCHQIETMRREIRLLKERIARDHGG